MACRIILRTDAGAVLGRFPNVKAAQAFAATLERALSLAITSADGVVLARRFAATRD